MSGRSRAQRLTQKNEIDLYTRQYGRCADCQDVLERRKRTPGNGLSLWLAEGNHSTPLSQLKNKNIKPNQLLCHLCHQVKTMLEASARGTGGQLKRAKIPMANVKEYLRAIHNLDDEIELAQREYRNAVVAVPLPELVEQGNWRPNINVTQKLIANAVSERFKRPHPLQFPQKQRVPNHSNTMQFYSRILNNEVDNGSIYGRLHHNIPMTRLQRRNGNFVNLEVGTRFYPRTSPYVTRGLSRHSFVKVGPQVTLHNNRGALAQFRLDGRTYRGNIKRVEWAGPSSVNVYMK